MDARDRYKLWIQETGKNFDCREQRKPVVERDRGNRWLQEREENYGCKGLMTTMAARDRGKKLWIHGFIWIQKGPRKTIAARS